MAILPNILFVKSVFFSVHEKTCKRKDMEECVHFSCFSVFLCFSRQLRAWSVVVRRSEPAACGNPGKQENYPSVKKRLQAEAKKMLISVV